MTEKTKATISFALMAIGYALLAMDSATVVDFSRFMDVAFAIIGSLSGAFGIYWTNPKKV